MTSANLFNFYNKLSLTSNHHYKSDSNLNYSHIKSIFKEELFTSNGNKNHNKNDHHCVGESVEIVSYNQFVKLLKSVELK
jgi:hypothetical protein